MTVVIVSASLIGAATVRGQTPSTDPAPDAPQAAPKRPTAAGTSARKVVADPPAPASRPVELPPVVADALAEFNRGAANMEKYEYAQAARAFNKVLEIVPDWTAAAFQSGSGLPEHGRSERSGQATGSHAGDGGHGDRHVRTNRAEGPRTSAVAVLPRHASGLPG